MVNIPELACGSWLVQKVAKVDCKKDQWRWASGQAIMLIFTNLQTDTDTFQVQRWSPLSSFYSTMTDFGTSGTKEKKVL